MGRHSEFTLEKADIICGRLAGGESLRSICRDDEMPDQVTVFKWLRLYPDFTKQYMRAREEQADAIFDECLEIANTPQTGIKKITKPGGIEIIEGDMIEHRRLQIDTRKWMAGKLRPKKYGERVGSNEPESGNEKVIKVYGGYVEAFKSGSE